MTPDIVALIVMVIVLAASVFLLRVPTGLALALASVGGALAGGFGFPVRHLAEGTMLYLDPILIVLTSLFFMRVFEHSGGLAALNSVLLRRFGSTPSILLIVLTLFVMFPGMLTGLTAPCVLTTGAMVAPLLVRAGLSAARAGAFIAVAAFFGMVAPPVNICAMIIGGGVDMPYIGFGLPLTLASFPLAFGSSFLIAGSVRRELRSISREAQTITAVSPVLFTPLVLILVLIAGPRLIPSIVPDLGVPLVFVLAAATAFVCGKRVGLGESARWATQQSLPILALLAGVGIFIQVLTLTGARGLIVVNTMLLPEWAQLAGMTLLVPVFGGVSAYGASSVLGVPFLLAMLERHEIIVAAALSLLASIGDFLPPTRLAVVLSASVVSGREREILRWCFVPAVLALLLGLGMILAANPLSRLLGLD